MDVGGRFLVVGACLLFTAVTTGHAWAQAPSRSRPHLLPPDVALSIDPANAALASQAGPDDQAAPQMEPQAPRSERVRLRRGRAFIATGATLMAAGLLQALVAGRAECSEPEKKLTLTRTLGGVTAGIGLSFAIGGAAAVLTTPRATRQAHRMRGLVAGTTLAGILGTGVVWGLLLLSSIGEFIGCVSS